MSLDAEHDHIIRSLYGAASCLETWHQAFVALSAWTGADDFHFVRWDCASQHAQFNLHSDRSQTAIEQYGACHDDIDSRRLHVGQGAVGQVSACQRRFDARFVSRSEFYQDYQVPSGMHHTLSSLVLSNGKHQMLVGLVRASERGAFDAAQFARLERLTPHLGHACKLWLHTQELHASAAIGRHVADSSGFAVFGLDDTGAVVYANTHAKRMLREQDSLVAKDGHLSATTLGDATRLQRAIAHAAGGSTAVNFPIDGLEAGPQACFVSVTGLALDSSLVALPGRTRVLVMARERSQMSSLAPEQLSQVFGLTRAECSVALALLDGKTPEAYALEAKLSMPTIRTQLRAVFAKTKTRGQVETVRLLQALPC